MQRSGRVAAGAGKWPCSDAPQTPIPLSERTQGLSHLAGNTNGYSRTVALFLICEVVDPFTRAPIRRGVGVLVITTLAPYVTTMPLIRYWTGDLVELGPRCTAADAVGFRPLGRFDQAIATRRDGVLVAPLEVSDFLEGRPDVACHAHPMEMLGVIPPGDCGAVKFELSKGPQVRVELRFDPLVFSDQARALGESLAKQLLKRPALRRFERSGRGELEIELLRPGSLQKQWVKF